MWARITPGDIEQAKHQQAVRRHEILARHAGELQALDADAAEVAELAKLVEAFMEKFKAPAPSAAGFASHSPQQSRTSHPTVDLAVGGFGRMMAQTPDPRLAPTGDVSIDFHRSRSG